MDKKTELGSSIYFSDKAFSLNSQGRPKGPAERKQAVRVEIVNQNLNDAIRQVRTNIKQNPEWNLKVRAVTDEYRPKKIYQPNIINESIQERPGSNFLPQGRKEPHFSQMQMVKKPDFQKLKYTERMKQEYEERMVKIKEKRMQLEVLSLQRQMKAKLERKVKENMVLRDKARLIQDIQEKREEKMRWQDKQHLTRREERSLLHQSNVAKVDMLRRSKKKAKNRQLSESLSRSQQAQMEIKFRDFLVDKEKKERKEMLVARFRMLRSASQGAMRQQRQQRTQSVKEIRKNQENKVVASDVFGQ